MDHFYTDAVLIIPVTEELKGKNPMKVLHSESLSEHTELLWAITRPTLQQKER